MALTYSFCTVLHEDCGVFTLQNNADYTLGGEVRSDTGDVLISALIKFDETETYITIDSTPYLSSISYEVNNTADGHYHSELLRFFKFNNANSYIQEVRDVDNNITTYANLIFYPTTNKFYKCKLNNPATSIAPDAGSGSTYWDEITDFTDSEVRLNTTIKVGIFDDIAACRSRKCVKDELYKAICKDPSCIDEKTLLSFYKKAIYLMGAEALNSDDNSEKAELNLEILANLCNTCLNCGNSNCGCH